MAKKGQRSTKDPHSSACEDTVDQTQYAMLCEHLISQPDAAAARNRSIYTHLVASAGRADEGRLTYLPDLMSPRICKCIGPVPCITLPVITKGAETQDNGKLSISTTIRHREPVLCPRNALAYHFYIRFNQMGEPFPDPRNASQWSTTPLWPGNDCNGSYRQQYADVIAYFNKLGIKVSKVTHSWRVYSAWFLDDMGVDNQVIARMGKWSNSALNKSYLLNYKPQGLLAIAGWPHAADNVKDQYFHERFCMTVPNSLVELVVFPFIKDLEHAIETMGKQAENSVRSVARLMRYLGVVLVQDALELAEKFPDNPVHQALLVNSDYQDLYHKYEERKQAGYFEPLRPKTDRENVAEIKIMLEAVLRNQAGLAGLSRQGVFNDVDAAANATDDEIVEPGIVRPALASREAEAQQQSTSLPGLLIRPPAEVISSPTMSRPYGALIPEHLQHSKRYEYRPSGLHIARPDLIYNEELGFVRHVPLRAAIPGNASYAPAPSAQQSDLPSAASQQPVENTQPAGGQLILTVRQASATTTAPSGAKAFPQLKALRSILHFWTLWEEGDTLSGGKAVKDIKPQERRGQGQRFHEWEKAAEAVMAFASKEGLSSKDAARLELSWQETKTKIPTWLKSCAKDLI